MHDSCPRGVTWERQVVSPSGGRANKQQSPAVCVYLANHKVLITLWARAPSGVSLDTHQITVETSPERLKSPQTRVSIEICVGVGAQAKVLFFTVLNGPAEKKWEHNFDSPRAAVIERRALHFALQAATATHWTLVGFCTFDTAPLWGKSRPTPVALGESDHRLTGMGWFPAQLGFLLCAPRRCRMPNPPRPRRPRRSCLRHLCRSARSNSRI